MTRRFTAVGRRIWGRPLMSDLFFDDVDIVINWVDEPDGTSQPNNPGNFVPTWTYASGANVAGGALELLKNGSTAERFVFTEPGGGPFRAYHWSASPVQWTWEFDFTVVSVASNSIILHWTPSYNPFGAEIMVLSGGQIRCTLYSDRAVASRFTSAAVSDGARVKLSICRNNGSIYYHMNGVHQETDTYSGPVDSDDQNSSTHPFSLGGSNSNPTINAATAKLHKLRITRAARYNGGDYTPDGDRFPLSAGPALTNPEGVATGPTSAGWSVETDGDTGTIYVIASQSITKPSALQIKAGEDHTGTPAAWGTNQPVTTTGAQSGTATGLSAGTWYFHFLWNDGSEDSAVVTSNSFTLEAGWAITQQPVNTTVYAYDNAEFRVVVTDPTGTATFQWYRVESGGNTPIAGETAEVLVIPSAALDDDGSQYLCVASRAGEADLTTHVVTLTVVARSTQVLPGSLHRVSYPSFFPCATWQFDQQIGPEVARTRFSSGWARQRKQWREEVSTGTMSFSMPTTMFDNWSRWMMNNGYQWFTLLLDRFFGVRALYEVRLTSRIDWKYRNHGVIDAAVRFELGSVVNSEEWDGLPDTEAPSDFGPDEKPPGIESRPECEPYSCSAYESAMRDGLGLEYFPLYSPSDSAWAFPFSGPSQLRATIGFTWPGSAIHDWAGSTNGFLRGTPLAWQQADSAPTFCDGEVVQCAMMDYSPGNASPGVFPPTPRWGSMAVGAIVTGLANSTRISGTFMSARTNWLFPGGNSRWIRADCRFIATADLGGGVVATGLQIQTYVFAETEIVNMDLGFIGDRWHSATARVRIYPLEVVGIEEGLITFKCSVEAVMSLGEHTLRKTQTGFFTSSGYPSDNNDTGNQNSYFYDARLSFMNLAGEFFDEDIDIVDIAGIAFDRNHPDYVPPGYCNI